MKNMKSAELSTQKNELELRNERQIIAAARIVTTPQDDFAPEFLNDLAYLVREATAGTQVKCHIVHWPNGVFAPIFADPDDRAAWERSLLDAYDHEAGDALAERILCAIEAFKQPMPKERKRRGR